MEKVKLICCDIDDTLLAKDKSLPEANCLAIKKVVKEKNIPFVILSGRSSLSVRDYMKQIGITGVVPSLGGCLIEDWNGNVIEEHNVNKTIALDLYNSAKEIGCILFAYYRNRWFIEPHNDYWEEFEANAVKIPATHADLPTFLKTTNPNKLLGVSNDPAKLKALLDVIKHKYNDVVDAFLSAPFYLEIVPHGINKGTAIDALCKYYNIEKCNVMAIGDYYNDVDMFKTAGISVAVNNAPDDIKAIAKYVTCADCTHGAVAEAIEKYAMA